MIKVEAEVENRDTGAENREPIMTFGAPWGHLTEADNAADFLATPGQLHINVALLFDSSKRSMPLITSSRNLRRYRTTLRVQ
jgi:hypothetical protein